MPEAFSRPQPSRSLERDHLASVRMPGVIACRAQTVPQAEPPTGTSRTGQGARVNPRLTVPYDPAR